MDGKKIVPIELTIDELGNTKRAVSDLVKLARSIVNDADSVDEDYNDKVNNLETWKALFSKLENYHNKAKAEQNSK